jgi:MarR family protease production transcriptional regulator HPr
MGKEIKRLSHFVFLCYLINGSGAKKDASISEIAKLGVMHVSTAINFSKKVREPRIFTIFQKGK